MIFLICCSLCIYRVWIFTSVKFWCLNWKLLEWIVLVCSVNHEPFFKMFFTQILLWLGTHVCLNTMILLSFKQIIWIGIQKIICFHVLNLNFSFTDCISLAARTSMYGYQKIQAVSPFYFMLPSLTEHEIISRLQWLFWYGTSRLPYLAFSTNH